jgi:hypothetical protein
MQPVPGARGLFAVRAASLGWYLLSLLIFALPLGERWQLWLQVTGVVWLMLGAAELAAAVPFSQGRQGTRAETAARALLIALAIAFIFSVIQELPLLGARQMALNNSLERSLGMVHTALFVTGDVCLWLSLTRSLENPPSWSAGFYALLSLSAAISLLHQVLTPEHFLKLYQDPLSGALLRYLRPAVGVTLQILPLVLLRRLLTGGAAPAGEVAPPQLKGSPGRDIAIGAIWLGAGLLVTLVSYSAAASENGGRYVVATGAIAYGLSRLVRGFVKL